MHQLDKLIEIAKKIPSIGMGGAAIPLYLVEAAAKVPSGEAIIDIGSWMGSTTGLLMCGIRQSGNDVEIHCYDQWIAHEAWRDKAKKYYDIDIDPEKSFLPMFLDYVKPFEIKPVIHQGDFMEQFYPGPRKIGLVIDDICSKKPMSDHMMDVLLSFCRPGTIFFLMDFYFFEHRSRSHIKRRQYQRDFMEANKDSFEFVDRPIKSGKKPYTAIYRYKGPHGKLIKPNDKKNIKRGSSKSYWKDWPEQK